jgi:hypothetical protein
LHVALHVFGTGVRTIADENALAKALEKIFVESVECHSCKILDCVLYAELG